LIPFFFGGCAGPYSMLDPAGPSAHEAAFLWWGMFGFFMLVLVAVCGLWLYAMVRDPGEVSPQAARKIQNRWIIGGGILLPGISILVILIFGIPAGHRMLPLPQDDVLRIDVTARQWHWEFHYPGTAITLIDQMHIPAGVPIDVHLTTTDVIHSFWVPRLAGKLDTIPGRINVQRLQADQPGIYGGQCAEFCGPGHAHMKFTVHAHSADDFAAWLAAEQAR